MDIEIENPLMIIGIGRSGTTLLQAMLNAHPDVCFPPESHFIRNFVANSEMQRIYNQKGIDAVERILTENKYVQRLKIKPEEALMPFREHKEEFHCGTLFKRYLYLYAKKKNKRRVGEKDPSNIYYLPEIKSIFRRAQIIHIIRDPRDVVLSRLNLDVGLGYGKSLEEWAFNYFKGLTIARKDGKKLFGNHYHEVYYEDLVTETEKTLRSLCERIRISFDPQMLSFQKEASKIVADDEVKWKKNVAKPIIKNNVYKWKKRLSKKQIKAIEIICSKVFRETKYEKSNISHVYLFFSLQYLLFLFKGRLRGVIKAIKDRNFLSKLKRTMS